MYRFLLLCLLPASFAVASELTPTGWGVVSATEIKTYTKEGKLGEPLVGGTLFTTLKNVTINKDQPAFYVEVVQRGKPRCILPDDGGCLTFQGFATNADAIVERVQQQSDLADYYSMLATRAKVVERARDRFFAKSPVKSLTEKKAQLAQIPELDRRLEAALNKAVSNGQRLKYRDQRKELKYQAIGLQEEIKRLEATAKTWETEHPFNEDRIKSSGVYRTLTRQLETLEPKVADLIPQPNVSTPPPANNPQASSNR